MVRTHSGSPLADRARLLLFGRDGAKALQVEGFPRDIQSVEGKLNQISGQGRVILTASGPTERAWESPRLGHGFLTLHLLEALQGPPY
jgi:helicase